MFDFFRNWQSIVSFGLVLVSFIISLISRSQAKRSSAAVDVVSQIAELCAEVESLFPVGFGDIKRGFVLRQVEKLCSSLHIKFDKAKVLEQIEKVLSAPCKYESKKEV